jgi:hypothetical protein
MSDINQKYSIDAEFEIPEAFDIYALRDKGIKLIQQYSGTSWTDHNLHDPGITILEQICFAIADVSYQTTQAIESAIESNQFAFSPYFKIDSTTPSFYTFEDLAKIIQQDERVYKVFVIPSLTYPTVSGVYDLVIFCEQGANREDVKKWVNEISNQWRPLCTKIESIHLPPIKPIIIDLEVEVNSTENIQDILQSYIGVIKDFLKGKNNSFTFFNEQITDPISFSKKIGIQLQAADLVAAINQIKFTKDIINIKLKDPEQEFIWTLIFDIPYELTIDPKSKITFKYSGTTIHVCTDKQLFQFDKKNQFKRKQSNFRGNDNFNRYTQFSSLQKGLPSIYNLERDFRDPIKTEDAGALQLKGLLSVFDLVISNFIGKLEVIYSFLNKKHIKFADLAEDMLLKIPGIEWVWIDFINNFEEVKVTKSKPQRYTYWKNYLNTYKDKLHEMVSMSSRAELDNIEQLISSYLYLLQLMGFNLELIVKPLKQLTALDRAFYLERLLEYWIDNKNHRIHTQNNFYQTSIQPSNTGYRGLISAILNLNFDTFSFSQNISKTWSKLSKPENHAFKIEQIKSIADLFIYGRNEKNYVLSEKSATIIKSPDNPIGFINKFITQEQIVDLCRKLKDIHDKSEGFLLFEHALLAPELEESVFGLNCQIEHSLYFYIEPNYTVRDIYRKISEIESSITNNSFKIITKNEGKRQYCNFLMIDDTEFKIDKFYGAEKDGVEDAQRIGRIIRDKGIKFHIIDYLYYRFANQIDPYSFTISLCFPNWIDKFATASQINSILQIIDKTAPPHLVVQCKWLNPKEFEFLMENFNKLTKGKSIDTEKSAARINLCNLLMKDEVQPSINS